MNEYIDFLGTEKRPESPERPRPSGVFRLEGMGESALIELRNQIDALLPVKRLSDISLEEEMVLQYRQVKALQTMVLSDSGIEVNKQSQVVNSCASALENLVKMQERYHHAERLKQIESSLIDTLNKMPEQYTKQFFEWYEEVLSVQ